MVFKSAFIRGLNVRLNIYYFYFSGVFLGAIAEETLESRLVASGRIAGNDVAGVLNFLKPCLHLEPAQRISSKDIVLNQWVRDGGACSCCYDS
jgi:hypothetical protein